MIATVLLAAAFLLQEPGPLDAILAKHTDSLRAAKTYDELTAAARLTLEEILRFLATKPDGESSARALAISADICAGLEDFEGAERHAGEFLKNYAKHPKAPLVLLNLGHIRTAAGRDAAARDTYQSLLRDYPDFDRAFDVRLRIAQSFMCERRDAEALKALADLRTERRGKPEEWAIRMQEAVMLQIAGQPGEGRSRLEEIMKSCPEPRTSDYAKRVLSNWLWIGKPAPPAEGWDLQGGAVRLDITGGKVNVLYFVGVAFTDFEAEAGVIRRLSKKFPAADFSVLAVAIDPDKTKLPADLARVGVTWPVLYDGKGFKGPVASAYRIDDLPMVLVIDRKNVIRYVNPIFGDHGRDIGRCVETLIAEK